ncbi:uncharacterized protein RJT21DRAFT_1394 [Scheffersomyces amazonensis]|uniref:uncharacterized protein n=1 Tax=Scheffersomyces amazonensis TaxID=1078765 RepID=UPI00315CB4FC
MKLEDIINTEDAVSALSGLSNVIDGEINPIQIDQNGRNNYLKRVEMLDQYLKHPNMEEVEHFLKPFNFSTDIPNDELLRIILRSFNFHILQIFDFPTTPQVYQVIKRIEPFLMSLSVQLFKYWSFSMSMSFRVPIIDGLHPQEQDGDDLNEADDTDIYGSTNQGSVKRRRTGPSSQPRETRSHSLKSYMGMVYPEGEVVDFSIDHTNDIKLYISDLKAQLDDAIMFQLENKYESVVQDIVLNNLFANPGACVGKAYGPRTEYDTFEGNTLYITPDLRIKIDNGYIPIECKRKFIKKYLDDFLKSEVHSKQSSSFVEIFTQCIREAVFYKINCFFISDYTTTLFIKFNDIGDFDGTNFCSLFRPMNCSILNIIESEYSLNFHLFVLLKDVKMKFQENRKICLNVKDKLFITSNARDTLSKCIYDGIDLFLKQVFQINNIPIPFSTLSHISDDLPPPTPFLPPTSPGVLLNDSRPLAPPSPGLLLDDSPGISYAYQNSAVSDYASYSFDPYIMEAIKSSGRGKYNPNLEFMQNRFRPELMDAALFLKKDEKFKIMTMKDIQNDYSIVSLISGSRFNSRISTVLEISKGDKEYILKITDPLRSSIFPIKESNVEESFKRCFKIHYTEVRSLSVLDGLNISPKIEYHGCLLNEGIDEFHEHIGINSGILPLMGFYIIMEKITGCTLKNYDGPNKEKLRVIAKDKIGIMHQHHVYHKDIHSTNIMITGDDVRYIDFGLSMLAGERAVWPIANRKPKDMSIPAEEFESVDDDNVDRAFDSEHQPTSNKMKSKMMHRDFKDKKKPKNN